MRWLGQHFWRGREATWRPASPVVALLCCFVAAAPASATDSTLDTRREAFREAWPAAERGDWRPVADRKDLLQDYVLWPDLVAAYLGARLATGNEAEIREFLERYGALRPARELRYRFALHLASAGRMPEYLEIYRNHYRNLGIARLDCLAANAEILAGRQKEIVTLAENLWLVGQSQVDECDPVFDYLRGAGLLDERLLQQRFELAVDAKQFSLARYLSRSMDSAFLDRANRWIAARNDAEKFLQSEHLQFDTEGGGENDSEVHRKQLLFAIERIAYSDVHLASGYWHVVRSSHEFSPEQAAHISRHIALSAAQEHRPDAFRLLDDLPDDATDVKVRRWQVRAALRNHAWRDVIAVINGMTSDERQAEEWQYWLAVALRQSGNTADALPFFRDLATKRSYYGFLAADELDANYAYAHATTHEDESILDKLAKDPSLIRARELFYVGLESKGRSEWDDAVSALDAFQTAQAAVLAHRWNWHSRAIAAVAAIGQYDDLDIRYPLPYQDKFEEYSATAKIPGSWAYGVARSESLFMSDIRSHAGAIGLMQLMPATGRRTAAELDLPYTGRKTLTDPVSNIRLGTAYLGKMLQRFDDNLVLATAAYNAGPFKVEEWLPESRRLDARIWIENIPYDETRSFVRRVLLSDTIFHWRLTGQTRRLSAELGAIDPAAAPERLTRAGRKTAAGAGD